MSKVRKKLSIILAFLLFAFLLSPLTTFSADTDVIANDETGIPDTALYNQILRKLNKSPGQNFTKGEAATITEISPYDFTSLKGLSNLSGLEYLGLFDAQLTNIDEIVNLTNLKTLDLTCNQLTSIDGIDKLTNLESLYLGSNQLTDIAPLEKIVGLKKLDLYSNQLTSVTGLEKLVNLESLGLSSNRLTSIAELEQMTSLKELFISYNQLTSVAGLENLTNLTALGLSGNKLSSTVEIEALTNLESLFLSDCSLNELPNLKTFTSLCGWKFFSDDMLTVYSDFSYNGFTKEEFMAKLPDQMLEETDWLRDQLKNTYDPENLPFPMGNPTGSGKPGMKDLLLMQKYIARMVSFSPLQVFVSDVNKDLQVTIKDVLMVQKYIAKIIPSLN